MTAHPEQTPREPQTEQSAAAAVTYVAAKLRASDDYLGFGARWVYDDHVNAFKVAAVAPEHAQWLASRLRSGLDAYGPRASYDTLEEATRDCTALAQMAKKLRTGTATDDERQQARDEVAQARALKAARTRKERKLAKQETRRPAAKDKDVAGSVPHVTVVAPFVPEPVLDPAPEPEPDSVPVVATTEPAPAVPVSPPSEPAPRPKTAEDRAPKGTTAAYAVAALRAAGRDPLTASSTDALTVLAALPEGTDGQAQARKALADPKLAARFAGYWAKRLDILRADRDQGR